MAKYIISLRLFDYFLILWGYKFNLDIYKITNMLKDHPKAITTLFFTGIFERFGFYILMAVFTLYMDNILQWDDQYKGQVYGLFLALVYILPIFGGWISDKWLGSIKTIQIGAIVMAVGYLLLPFTTIDKNYIFYIGLIIITIGNGLYKPNIFVMVGSLYNDEKSLKDIGYNIFYIAINIGAFLSPLIATFILGRFGFNQCFILSSIGIIISIIIFTSGTNQFNNNTIKDDKNQNNKQFDLQVKTIDNNERLKVLFILIGIMVLFWMVFFQNGFALTLFAKRSTIQYKYLKAETYQFFNPFFILVITPIIMILFNHLQKAKKEPSIPAKISTGMFIGSIGILIMVFASMKGGNNDIKILSPVWLIGTYFIITIAEILISPIGISYVSKVAPIELQGTVMGLWFGAIALGAYGSGLIGGFYSKIPHHLYFLILTLSLVIAGFTVLLFRKKLNRFSQ